VSDTTRRLRTSADSANPAVKLAVANNDEWLWQIQAVDGHTRLMTAWPRRIAIVM